MRKSIETDGRLGARSCLAPSAHRLDEFPAGYSSAGCSPAEPASASPVVSECAAPCRAPARMFQRTVGVSVFCCLSLGVHAIGAFKAVPLGASLSGRPSRLVPLGSLAATQAPAARDAGARDAMKASSPNGRP